MKCEHCGAGISQEMKNCPYCGTGLGLPAASSETGGQTQLQNQIRIQIQSNFTDESGFQQCPKCKEMIPLSKVIVAKRAPTIGQWILAVILGVSFIACCQIEVKESVELVGKIILIVFFGSPLVLLLWLMFTRRFWICPACHKVIKVPRNLGTKFPANSKDRNMR